MINKYMRIEEIITEHVNTAKGFVNGNMIDPELQEIEKRLRQMQDGLDPDHAEAVQDFPI